MNCKLLRCMSLMLALFGHALMSDLSPLSGEERKLDFEAARSAFDPQRTFGRHLLSSGKVLELPISRHGRRCREIPKTGRRGQRVCIPGIQSARFGSVAPSRRGMA